MDFFKQYLSRKYAPRWVILTIDVFIVSLGVFLAYLLRFNFSIGLKEFEKLPWVIALYVGIRGFTFRAFRTYSGVVRHTSIEDSKKLFFANASGSLLIFFVSGLIYAGTGRFLIPLSVFIIEFFATLVMMTAFRVMVKVLYDQVNQNKTRKKAKNVVIYGAGQSGLITKRAIDQDGEVQYNVNAFLDDDKSKRGKVLEGVTIYSPERDFDKVFGNQQVDLLIFSIQEIKPDRKQEIIEWCLRNDIKVKSVPPANKWINGELSFNQIKNAKIEDLLERNPIQLDRKQIADEITGKTVMVTGASGSIGSELVRQLVNFKPAQIILLDLSETSLNDLTLELNEKLGFNKYVSVVGDIRNENRIEKVIKEYRPTIIYHAAAYKHVPILENNPAEAVDVNVEGTRVVADKAVKYDVEKFVLISTDKAVNPTNVMGASKRLAEIYTQSLNRFLCSLEADKYTRFITTRFGNVLGSNGSVIPRFRQQIENGGPVTVTHPDITRYFMTIPEACQLVLEAGSMGEGGEIFLFDMGKPVKIADLAKKMIKLSGFEPERDISISFTGLRPGEKISEEVLSHQENSMATHHHKIMIAAVREYDFEAVSNKIKNLIDRNREQKEDRETVLRMKRIIPEFKSQNSSYEDLDAQLSEEDHFIMTHKG